MMIRDPMAHVTIEVIAVTRRNLSLSEFDENQLIRSALRVYFDDSAGAEIVLDDLVDSQTGAWGPYKEIVETRGRQTYSTYEWEISEEEYFDRFGYREDNLDWAFSAHLDAKVRHPAIQGRVALDLFSSKRTFDLIVEDLRLEIEGRSLIYYHLAILTDSPGD